MSDVTILSDAVAANPTDYTARLVLADALQEAGREADAQEQRREAAALALRHKILTTKAWLSEDQVYTLGIARARAGYAARAAERYLASHPEVMVYVYANTAVTKTGFVRCGNGRIAYHRRSSGGRWGRSAQLHSVELA